MLTYDLVKLLWGSESEALLSCVASFVRHTRHNLGTSTSQLPVGRLQKLGKDQTYLVV